MLKKTIGYSLFAWSFIGYGLTLAVPFVGLTSTMIATVITSLIISAEAAFAVSLLLLGREFWEQIKRRVVRRKKPSDEI